MLAPSGDLLRVGLRLKLSQTVVDTTVGRPKPPGNRGAVMADTLEPAISAVSKQH